jgi:hypothetical protein
MHFSRFVASMPKQNDEHINYVISLIKKDTNFPLTSEPTKLAIYLYRLLNHKQTTAFQQLLFMYSTVPGNLLPKKCLLNQNIMLDAINIIVSLQNFDMDYAY